ncbi:hypothetical protein Btru_027706 [Bulinus truncatus]|nr:hypothetical protein Btru_027706 [Bulinus truncatus]
MLDKNSRKQPLSMECYHGRVGKFPGSFLNPTGDLNLHTENKMYRLLTFILVVGRATVQGQADPCQGTGSGSLASRLLANIHNNDANNDSVVTGDEIRADLTSHYDKDSDGCVSLQEWVGAWAAAKFSAQYATARLQDLGANVSSPCPLSVNQFQGVSIPLVGFVNANLDSLIKLCEGDQSLYGTVCDCYQLKHQLCSHSDYFKDFASCQKYVSAVLVG